MRTDDESVNWAEVVKPSRPSRKARGASRGGCKKALGGVGGFIGAGIAAVLGWQGGPSLVRGCVFIGGVLGSLLGMAIGAAIDAGASPQ